MMYGLGSAREGHPPPSPPPSPYSCQTMENQASINRPGEPVNSLLTHRPLVRIPLMQMCHKAE